MKWTQDFNTLAIALLCFLLVTFISDVDSATIKLVSSYRHFFRKPATEAPRLTCWTCPKKSDNNECNDWAPNTPCIMSNHTVCMTIHHMDIKSGISLSVDKKCATLDQCNSDVVGCHDTPTPGVQKCVSCCTSSYCNEPVPANHTSALRLSADVFYASGARHGSHLVYMTIVLLLTLTFTLLQ